MTIRVCLAGATGWAGSELARAIAGTEDIALAAAVSRKHAGRELAARLAKVRSPEPTIPVDRTVGPREARGATLSGSQVHSIRLPGYVISAEVIFGMPDQKLSLRHDSGGTARPYVDGAPLAIRKVSTLTGIHRGLDTVLAV